MPIDRIDRRILEELQRNGRIPNSDLAARVGLSESACLRRVRTLEAEGYIERYAAIVGRENVIAGADCGYSSRASYQPEVHPTVVWEKFRALAEGARLATQRLW